ncbi:MAG: 6-carboxytetrahydropterin synthase QueD [Clostridium sp.]|nr:6-carboxytetrahydropterin synthase QueD [Clostridium sp.]
MYCLKVEHSFDSAHFLHGYEGKCGNIHGHRWKVEVEIKSEELKRTGQCFGMVVDFSDLKKDVKEIVDYYDHALIIESNSMREETLNCLKQDGFRIIEVEFRPTAENFSKYFFKYIEDKGYTVNRVSVYETPNNCATYQEG